MYLDTMALVWFMGFGHGSNRGGISLTALIVNTLNIVEQLIFSFKSYSSLVTAGFSDPFIFIPATIGVMLLYSFGYAVGRAWFQT